jgi:hypothetical protein
MAFCTLRGREDQERVGEKIGRAQQGDQQRHRQDQPRHHQGRRGGALPDVVHCSAIGAILRRPYGIAFVAKPVRSLVRFKRGNGRTMCAISIAVSFQDTPVPPRLYKCGTFFRDFRGVHASAMPQAGNLGVSGEKY